MKFRILLNYFTDLFLNLFDMHDSSFYRKIADVYSLGTTISNGTLNHPATKKLLQTDQEFDVIILEICLTEPLLGFAHKFKAPIIGVSTFVASKWTTDLVGSPSPPSFVPHPFLR